MNSHSGRTASKRHPHTRKGRTAAAAHNAVSRSDRTSWIVAVIVIAVGDALVFAFADGSHQTGGGAINGDQPAPAALVSAVTGVPQRVLDQVGEGSVTGLPGKLPGPLLTSGGKPRIVYLGAEYCPYCATERWAMVQAFSRFGTFKNLKINTSSSTDVDPNTPTFSFYGAAYTSNYITFESVEEQDNKGKPLEQPTSEQAQLAAEFDRPPYTSGDATSTGTIPFIGIADEYIISGATYDVGVLQDKTHAEIAAALSNPTNDISQGAIGAANAITAAVCKVTANQPTNACTTPAVTAIEAKLPTK